MDISLLLDSPNQDEPSSPALTPVEEQSSALTPVKKSRWSEEENTLIIDLRGNGMKWGDISKRLSGRSATSCRLHYQNYLERREWDDEKKDRLARLYER